MDIKNYIKTLFLMAEGIVEGCEEGINDPEQVHRYGALVYNKVFMKGYATACREIMDAIEEEERKEVKKNGRKKGRDANQGS